MQNEKVTFAKDYCPPAFLVDRTFLRFDLADEATQVSSRLHMRRNPMVKVDTIVLDGQFLQLESVRLDGRELSAAEYMLDEKSLQIPASTIPDQFVLECVTIIHPEKNTALEGLYQSRGMYCTQCEAEGFRRITYYPDRPDVMSEFEVQIVADDGAFPVMLSNGNCVEDIVEAGKRKVTWHDPFKKPSYLFALVAGDLACLEDTFVTCSGRDVALKIYVEPKDLGKCRHAMESLKNAMRWDEETYGREYDLDIYMIVAVDDFNMGAMENKGLNIFNTSCVLADPATTTDEGFERVEAVVAHEYFHNWSGNRVTCRDWFQLSLKEGFTVFRDAEFSADMNSRDVKRIEDVMFLRSVQFAEDAGPMAHPVRPDSYIEISNFYTVTIYEKGAEVVRMMSNILGQELFRKATDLYFMRHDGQAVSCEDFVRCMEDVSGIDFQQFRLWYSQSGTPLLRVSDSYDEKACRYSLSIEQVLPKTPGQPDKKPFHIPVRLALYGEAGAQSLHLSGVDSGLTADNTEVVLHVRRQLQTFHFEKVTERPVPSLLRGFSAPVKLEYEYSDEQLAHLAAIDTDGFSRWDACQTLATKVIRGMVDGRDVIDSRNLLFQSLGSLLGNPAIDDAMKALMLVLPADSVIADYYDRADPLAIFLARKRLRTEIAGALRVQFLDHYHRLTLHVRGLSASARSARSLRNVALGYLMLLDDPGLNSLCVSQFQSADCMTDQFAALKCLVNSRSAAGDARQALEEFYRQWRHESLVVNMWLQVQASAEHDHALADVRSLLKHESFDYTNPNKVRALIAGFSSMNPSSFHDASGEGYRFLAEQVLQLDQLNPQIASRLLTPLTRWRKMENVRSLLMRQALEAIAAAELSPDAYEVVSKSLLD